MMLNDFPSFFAKLPPTGVYFARDLNTRIKWSLASEFPMIFAY